LNIQPNHCLSGIRTLSEVTISTEQSLPTEVKSHSDKQQIPRFIAVFTFNLILYNISGSENELSNV